MEKFSKEKVINVINTNFENDVVTILNCDDNLVDLGMDSLVFMRIVVDLEETFECEIPDSKLLISELDTINKICDVLNDIV